VVDSNASWYVIFQMLQEAGVRPILSAYSADPILRDNTVCGVYVETKPGRQTVKAKVVIDASGEADVGSGEPHLAAGAGDTNDGV